MPAASTVAHALTAIKEALTVDQTGDATKPRALAAAELFRRGYPRGVDRTVRSREARQQKTAFVAIGDLQPDAGPAYEVTDRHLWRLQVVVSRDYHIGYEFNVSDLDTWMATSADDTMKIAAALCWPDALSTTIAGDPTGLAGAGALSRAGARSKVAIERVGDELAQAPRLLNVTDTVLAEFDFDPS